MAVRDGDYAAMVFYPASARLDDWLSVYEDVARGNGAEPSAARHLLAWAHTAGFEEATSTASTWCFATPEERDWWGGLWADRITQSTLAFHAARPEMRARILGLLSVSIGMGPVGFLQVGLLADAVGAQLAIIILSAEGALALLLTQRFWREIRMESG